MTCSRCGGEAVVKRENAVYCGKCALARDWEEIIILIQQERVSLTPAPAPPPVADGNGASPNGAATAQPPAPAAAQPPAPAAPQPPQPVRAPQPAPAAPSGDPFA